MDSWQHQCCGKDFRVGDVVTWTLAWDHDEWVSSILGASHPGFTLELDTYAAEVGTAARRGGLRVSLLDAAPIGPKVVIGIPREEHHHRLPDSAPATAGQIVTIHEVHVTHRRGPNGTWYPLPWTTQLREVRAATRWSAEEQSTWGNEEPRIYEGMLIELEVADAHDADV